MEGHQNGIEIRPDPVAEEGKRGNKIKCSASPAEQECHLAHGEEFPQEGHGAVLWKPDGKRLGMQQPICIELGQTRVTIDQPQHEPE